MKWLRRGAWAVGGVLVLWVLAWLIVPPVLKSQAEQRLGDALGRSVSFGEVSFSPWSLELTVRDIAVGGNPADAASAPLLTVARAYVNAEISSLLRLAPVIEAFEVDAPALRLARTSSGHYDIDDLIARFAPTQPAPPPSEPLRFAVYNVKVTDASVHFDDRPVRQQHRLEALQLGLPFLANLPSKIDVNVEPRLAFRLNDTAFDTGAQATPFAQSRAGTLQLKMDELDLVPYLGYLPESLPVRLRRGSVAADITLGFALPEGAAPSVVLRGQVGVKDLAIDDAQSAPLLAWKQLSVALREVKPLNRELGFGEITLDAPTLHVTRDAQGQLNVARLAGPPSKAAVPAVPASGSSVPPASAAANPWKVQVEALRLNGMSVRWADAGVTPAAALVLDAIDLKAGPLAYPFAADGLLPVGLTATLAGAGEGAAPQGAIAVEGRVSDRQAQLAVTLSDLALAAFAPYVSQSVAARVSGSVAASAQIEWAAGDAPRLSVGRGEFTLAGLTVVDGIAPLPGKGNAPARPAAIALKQLTVQGAEVDVLARRVTLASVKIAEPAVALSRDREGLWNVQRWVKGGGAVPAADARCGSLSHRERAGVRAAQGDNSGTRPLTPTLSPEGRGSECATAVSEPWRIELRDLALDGGSVRVDDALVAGRAEGEPTRLDLRGLKLGVQNLALSGARTSAPAKVQLTARLLGPREAVAAADKASGTDDTAAGGRAQKGLMKATVVATTGTLDWRGQLGLQPLMVKGTARLERFPLHAFEPYVRERIPVSLLRAEAGVKAEVSVKEVPNGMDIGVKGDVLLADVLVHSRPAGGGPAGIASTDELLSWQSFKLSGVTLALAPAQAPKIDIAEAALADFYSRLVITEDGRFNLQDMGARDADGAPITAPAPAEAASAPLPSAPVATPTAEPAVASAASAAASAPPLELSIGGTKLINGRIDFTDRFVRPNYSAALTELNGSLGAFKSGSREMATLALQGRAEGTALLDISGQLNPTAQPLALNIRAKATDLELAPLSPYAAKYAGYAIERGKLSMDVSYAITPDGKLDAKNQVVLNQLTFGERIDSPTATKLPVLLAVALLKDRHGVIDINLPVSGSLNDPQFSVGGIIFKVIVNLIAKALTAPFSLLFGGGSEDLSAVAFTPGVPRFTESGAAALAKVAVALADRPSLKMTVTGASDLAVEREAYVQAALDARLLQERKKEAARGGADGVAVAASGAPAAAAVFAEGERDALLKAVYKQTDIEAKPRNLVGLAKSIPPAEMEALLKSTIVVNEEAMRQLALQRGLAVRDALIAKGLPSERLFIALPKVRGAAEATEPWLPSAQLSLKND